MGSCRHGEIEANVVIEGGQISATSISQCVTRYSCDLIRELPPEAARRQTPDVDRISGATKSSDAVFEALRQAKI